MARRVLLAALALAACARPVPSRGPIVLDDDAGIRTTLSAPATRIVSLVPATTEILFALGGGDAVVGRTRWCDYPPAALAKANVGDGMQPSVETVVSLAPDLIVIYRSPANGPGVERFRGLGIPVIEVAIDGLDDLDRATRLLAAALGRPAAGDSLVAAVRDSLERATVTRPDPPRVFIHAWDQPPMTLGAGSYLSEILARAGARNLFDDQAAPSFPVSIEAVADRDPDLILLTSDSVPGWAERPEWQAVRAVRERRFIRVIGSEFNRPSPRVARAVQALADSLAGFERR